MGAELEDVETVMNNFDGELEADQSIGDMNLNFSADEFEDGFDNIHGGREPDRGGLWRRKHRQEPSWRRGAALPGTDPVREPVGVRFDRGPRYGRGG